MLGSLLFSLGVLIGYATAGTATEEWVTTGGPFYVNTGSVAYHPGNTVSLWMRVVPEKSSTMFLTVQNLLKDKGKDYRTYEYTGLLREIDCANERYRELTIIHYNRDRNILYSMNTPKASWKALEKQNGSRLLQAAFCPDDSKRITEARNDPGESLATGGQELIRVPPR
jgi:hypothetical protein